MGAYSLFESRIESTQTTNINLYGAYSAYGASLHCQQGHVCIIWCYSRTACSMFYIQCDGMCQILTSSWPKTIYPIENILEFIPNPNILLYDSATITMENDIECSNQSDESLFDDYQQGNYLNITSKHSSICCRGTETCVNTEIVAFEHNIICGGSKSCKNSLLFTSGSIHCDAYEACMLSMISAKTTVFCLGQSSCSQATIKSASIIYCSGESACHSSSIISNGNNLNLYLLGHGLGRKTVYCNASDICSVHCLGYDSCTILKLDGDGVYNVECNQESGCPYPFTPGIASDFNFYL